MAVAARRSRQQQPIAIVRAAASARIGIGHVMRCRSLAHALRQSGWTCLFAADAETRRTVAELQPSDVLPDLDDDPDDPSALAAAWPNGVDLLVVDHYGWDADREARCRPWARRVVVVDDLADRPHDCDVLVDQTLGRTEDGYRGLVPPRCELLLGPEFALLRSEFAERRQAALTRRARMDKPRRILVNFGGGRQDPVIRDVLLAISAMDLDADVDLVLGASETDLLAGLQMGKIRLRVHPRTSDMAGMMSVADLAIGAGGVSTWERCCLGLPSIIVVVADNQREIAAAVADAGAAITIDSQGPERQSEIRRALALLWGDRRRYAAMSRAAAAICDGLGAQRVASRFS